MNSRFFALLALMTLLLSACHSSAQKPAAPVSDACEVLTPAEIGAVLGVSIDPGKHIPASAKVMCGWAQTGQTGEAATKLMLHFATQPYFQKEKAASGNVTVTPASGIGDEAFYVTSEFGTSLFVRKGDTAIDFSIRDKSLPKNDLMAKERALGLKAAERL
ncbi:MAG: hypothetical protein WCC25_16405 [Candidatus Korobacteraceae bacterium]